MKDQEKTPLQRAEEEIPRALYELQHKWYLLGSVSAAIAYNYLYQSSGTKYTIPIALTSAGLYIVGAMADRISSIKMLHALNQAESIGLERNTEESNVIVGPIQTAAEFTSNPKVLAIDGLATAASAYSPGVGIPFAGAKIIAALNNFRGARRIERATQIAQNEK